MKPRSHSSGGHAAVPAYLGSWDFLDTQDRSVPRAIDVNELGQSRNGGVDHFVSQHDGEGLVADEVLCAQHGVPQAQRFGLSNVAKVRQLGDSPNVVQKLALPVSFEVFLQLERAVELVLNLELSGTCYYSYCVCSR